MTVPQIITILLLVLVLSCSRKATDKSVSPGRLHWQSFTIKLEDTCIVYGNIMSDSIEITNLSHSSKAYYIGSQSRDSLAYWANSLIAYQMPQQYRTCTDFVGKLRVKVYYSNTLAKQVDFTSICNWKEISMETRKIDSLLTTAVTR